jgi:hypothetical protein
MIPLTTQLAFEGCVIRVVGRVVAQAVSRWFSTAAARVRTGLSLVGFVVDEATLGQVFSEYFGFPCHAFHRLLHTHHHPGLVQ